MKNTIKTFLISMTLLSLWACPAYDPPQKGIEVLNYTDSAIYVCFSCTDSMSITPRLRLFDTVFYNGIDHIISPHYRVNAFSYGGIGTTGREMLINNCSDKKLRLFFIRESTLRNYSWDEIYKSQLFEKRIEVTTEELTKLDWIVTYK